jgi:hypothetical protein
MSCVFVGTDQEIDVKCFHHHENLSSYIPTQNFIPLFATLLLSLIHRVACWTVGDFSWVRTLHGTAQSNWRFCPHSKNVSSITSLLP